MEREIMRPETREGEVQLELVGGERLEGLQSQSGGCMEKRARWGAELGTGQER